uniref:Uncharacterized protein n=1 Tax=Arundo donax TaxID=35708 RepID=A0A0A9CK74_ARUDO
MGACYNIRKIFVHKKNLYQIRINRIFKSSTGSDSMNKRIYTPRQEN